MPQVSKHRRTNRTLPGARAAGRRAAALIIAAVAVLASCVACGSGGEPTLTVFAASSLQDSLTAYGNQFPGAKVKLEFAGSDQLEAQIEGGARPDVFASANLTYPQALTNLGLAGSPVDFASNELVLATQTDNKTINSLADAEKPGANLVVGTPTVPAGSYFQTVLNNMLPPDAAKLTANIRSREPDVTSISGKLTSGAAQAGFLYLTDVLATNGRLRAIHLPINLQPIVSYGVVVIKGTKHAGLAQAFVGGLMSGAGRTELTRYGFGTP